MGFRSNETVINLTMDYIPYISKMIQNGMYIDLDALVDKKFEIMAQTAVVMAQVREMAGPDFNPGSWQQLLKFLRANGVKIRDTAEGTLAEHESDHPMIPLVLKLRGLNKLESTYCDGYAKWIDKDFLIHSKFGVQGTETTRLNSKDPNLQNTPRSIRPCFKSRYGAEGVMLSSDLSALEYREIAHCSRDKKLLDIFRNSRDIHKEAAKYVLGYPDDMIKEQRKEGKTLNYAAVYGAGEEKVYKLIGRRDQGVYKRIKGMYPGVDEWKEEVLQELNRNKHISNFLGYEWDFEFMDQNIEREVVNRVIQSAGHMILMVYLMEVDDNLTDAGLTDVLLVNENHDSFMYDCPKENLEKASLIVNTIGSDLNPLIEKAFGVKMRVPMFAEMEVTETWT